MLMQKDHTCFLLSMSEYGELWKHQNNPACTGSVKACLQSAEVGHHKYGMRKKTDVMFHVKNFELLTCIIEGFSSLEMHLLL